jgi:hypothetical protein
LCSLDERETERSPHVFPGYGSDLNPDILVCRHVKRTGMDRWRSALRVAAAVADALDRDRRGRRCRASVAYKRREALYEHACSAAIYAGGHAHREVPSSTVFRTRSIP